MKTISAMIRCRDILGGIIHDYSRQPQRQVIGSGKNICTIQSTKRIKKDPGLIPGFLFGITLLTTSYSPLLNNGIPVLVVSKILGHAKASTTLDIYGYLISVKQEEAASMMDELTMPIAVQMNRIVSKQPNVK